ncbi:MAG: ribonuclease P protein component [Bacteroidota bacterium]
MSLKFPKSERLKSRKLIEQLFSEGKSISKFPVKMFYLPVEELERTQATFAVPKRNFKLAVTRNRIKRQMREAYRLHKHLLSDSNGKTFALLFLYISKNKPKYATLDTALGKLLKATP